MKNATKRGAECSRLSWGGLGILTCILDKESQYDWKKLETVTDVQWGIVSHDVLRCTEKLWKLNSKILLGVRLVV